MIGKVYSLGLVGIDTFLVSVEVDISNGIPAFDIVGLPDAAVRESRDRVRAAIRNCSFAFPQRRIIINLAPADTKKQGAIYDLPIMVALLQCMGEIQCDLSSTAFLGELSLSGDVRGITGVLPMVIEAKKLGVTKVLIPYENAPEGSVIEGIEVYAVRSVGEVVQFLQGNLRIPLASTVKFEPPPQPPLPDFSDVKGQMEAKRAIEIAAAGGHNLLMIGPPGSGKSMLAKRIPSILPQMSFEESVETTKIHSVSGIMPSGMSMIKNRPFRSPHHTVSAAGLTGGGTNPKPGDISLAHNGILFLDELPEFTSIALEVLRQPLEDGHVTISRVKSRLTYPSNVMLIAAMNPCPCGFFGHPTKKCICTPQKVAKYLNKISGPLLDRIDIHIEVPPVEFNELTSNEKSETSEEIKIRVETARDIQRLRYKDTPVNCNANISTAMLSQMSALSDEASNILQKAFEYMGLSARAYDRILKVSRTIADLSGSDIIKSEHVAEAVQYRSLDRKYWNK